MFKVIYLVKRRPGMTHQEFVNHWYNVHAPLACKSPIVKKYFTNEIKSESKGVAGGAEGEPEWDGVSELWFESREAMDKGFASPAGQADLADIANFVDPDGVIALFVDEKQQM